MNPLPRVLVALVTGPLALLGVTAMPASAALLCQGRTPTIVGTAGDDTLRGTAGADVVLALAGDDVVLAGAGDDVVCGGRGIDRLSGEAGDDALYGERNGVRPVQDGPDDSVGDTLAGGPGDDRLVPGAEPGGDTGGGFFPDTLTYLGAEHGVQVDLLALRATGDGTDTLVLDGRVDLVGSQHGDLLLGSPRDDWIRAMAGDDTVDGRGGDDRLIDRLDTGTGDGPDDDDQFLGGTGDDYLDPGRGDDLTRGGAGRDIVEDLWGVPDMLGGPGHDELTAAIVIGADRQQVSGGAGPDSLALAVDDGGRHTREALGRVHLGRGVGIARWEGAAGRARLSRIETLAVPEGRWKVLGSRGPDTVLGPFLRRSRLVARLSGGADTVVGGPGPDLLVGGSGRDFARPGGGYDVCRSVEITPAHDHCESG